MEHTSNWIASILLGLTISTVVVVAYDRGVIPNTLPSGSRKKTK